MTVGSSRASVLHLAVFVVLLCAATLHAEQPVSIVDYMKAVGSDSAFANRKRIYLAQWPNEAYSGTAEQNLRLLKHLLTTAKQVMVPLPSSQIEKCKEFYEHPDVSARLSKAFAENAVVACIVTGTKTPQSVIRVKLQETYRNVQPANGKILTAEEHKAIHDQAYKAAGCKEDSAYIVGWHIVDAVALPSKVVDLSIQYFGECSMVEEK